MDSDLTVRRTARAFRALGMIALTSVLAPATFMVLLWACIVVLHPSRGVGLPELVGSTTFAVIVGCLPAIACCVAALCCVWLAVRLRLASLPAFTIGGAVLAFACWTGIVAGGIVDWSFGWGELIVSLTATGVLFGSLWWAGMARQVHAGLPRAP